MADKRIVLTTFDIDSNVYEALRAGASGFLLRNAPPEDLVDAIRIVASGAGLLDLAVTRRVQAVVYAYEHGLIRAGG